MFQFKVGKYYFAFTTKGPDTLWLRLGELVFFREEPGVISDGPCWCIMYKGYFYVEETIPRLLRLVLTQWNDDRHLVG